ncbi:hypothetical protein BN14_01938 [Rhizoctonia solani AG-1 IB]|uniref:Uncharacterized protein n=1 Tax=Thanatephorus cucumeris (strain AG1-IB / isolate 7/3/14) TaxID=1108050 RepID=M5BW44_THACB|nr:hypothetical protein BN14_01938 [Rhizoctonia solani AG-1 IB]
MPWRRVAGRQDCNLRLGGKMTIAMESNRVSTRALAVTRFKRNHELLAEIFAINAAASVKAVPSPYEKTDKAELEAKLEQANRELAELREKVNQQEHDMEDVITVDDATSAKEAPKTST